jgi:hypothetical protein
MDTSPTSPTSPTADDARRAGAELEQSTALDAVARIGLVTYGAVHLVLAWLALQLAIGHTSKDASTAGAMRELAGQPLGTPLLWSITVGMFLLVLWRLEEAAVGHREHTGVGRGWRRVLSAGKAVVYGAIGASALRVATGHSSSGRGPRGWTAQVLAWPAGPAIVAVAGLAVIGFGVGLVVVGWTGKFAERMDAGGRTGANGTLYRWLGRVGYVAKGCAVGVVGGLIGYAGLTHDPDRSGGLDQALQRLLQQPGGPALTVGIGAGLGCFGLFCFAWSRHLDR